MISYLGSLVQFSTAAGRVGAAGRHRCVWGALAGFRTHGVCPAQGCLCFPPSTLLRLLAAVYGAGPALSAVPVFGSSTKAWTRLRLRVLSSPPQRFRQPKACARSPGCGVPFPPAASGPGSQRFVCSLHGCGAPFPSAAPARAAGRVSGSLQTGPGAGLPGGRGWLLWG